MGFQLSGASSISPSAGRALVVGGSDPDDTVGNMHVSGTKVILLTAADGINEGTHTIQAAYQAGSTSTGSQIGRASGRGRVWVGRGPAAAEAVGGASPER